MEPETNLKPDKKGKAATGVIGRDVPFDLTVTKKLPAGVDEETRLFHGIHPENFERLAVTLEGLQAEFGDKLGEAKYLKIAGIAGGSVFFNPNAEATNYRPPLGIAGLKGKNAETVAAILAAEE
jgi:N-acetylglutamate synthase/N-acetylornithine aminotransferase